MCGRYVYKANHEKTVRQFRVDVMEALRARYNIAPSQPVAAIREDRDRGTRACAILTWGLVPFWAKDPAIAHQLTNARSETAAGKPAFRGPMRHKRCLIPADGFYEWKRIGNHKEPWYFQSADGSMLALAGLWDHWGSPDGSEIESCTILTTAANDDMDPIHHRMPVVIPPEHYDRWLDPTLERSSDVADLLKAPPVNYLKRHAVSPRVNSTREDDPELIEAVAPEPPAPEQGSLFDDI